MDDDAVRRVAMVDVAVEEADAEVATHEAAGAQGGTKQWWRRRRRRRCVEDEAKMTPSNYQGLGEYWVC